MIFIISVILVGIGMLLFLFGSVKQTNGVDLPPVANIGIYLFVVGIILCIIGAILYLINYDIVH